MPALVRRADVLSDAQLRVVLRNFLLVALYRAHRMLAYYSSWEGLRPWDAPEEWRSLRGDMADDAFAAMLGWAVRNDEDRLVNARLRQASGVELYDRNGSPGLYVLVPRRVARNADGSDICAWFIPQLEYGWPPAPLPDSYRLEGWYVDKLSTE
jgi:hypothetical protein